ncbi:MAG: hypothetical protein ACRYGI_11385 [Janthinobacterium lividum]
MTILASMQSAALALMGRRPTAFFASTGRFEQEIADLVNEAGEDIAQYQDWTQLQAVADLTGDGVATSFALPSDYGRMMIDSDVQASVYRLWGYFAYPDLSAFMRDTAAGFQSSPGGWIITGGQIQFNPAPAGDTRFAYISNQWARSTAGTPASQFSADTDTFVLSERLLKLWLIWRWREQKKLDASGDQEAFVKALDEYAAKDGGSRVYRYGGRRSFPGTHLAWPWALGPSV